MSSQVIINLAPLTWKTNLILFSIPVYTSWIRFGRSFSCHHYAYRTEQTYCNWIPRFIRFYGTKTHPKRMDKKEIEAFLSDLARRRKGRP
jgi:hypothetical protein